MPQVRLYGEISEAHEKDFRFIKGFFGCKNNGEALQKMIAQIVPILRTPQAGGSAISAEEALALFKKHFVYSQT